MKKSKPEPAPKRLGEIIPESLIIFFQNSKLEESLKNKLIELIMERDIFGREKYGQPLMSMDGRDTVEDARQEIGDLLQYTHKAIINGEDLGPIKELVLGLNYMLNQEGEK